MTDFWVLFTNNPAEHSIRMVKRSAEDLRAFRSSEGASNFCRVREYISTVKKNGVSVLMAIKGARGEKPFIPSAT